MKRLVLFIKSLFFISLLIFITSFSNTPSKIKAKKTFQFNTMPIDTVLTDTIAVDSSLTTYLPYKENVHASYYHDKFNGRKTASGQKFDNSLYTAAHRTLKFGTKIKVTNTVNNQSVIVTVNDRGPFIKDREIDLSRKAFMEITKNKFTGFLIVHLEVLKE